MARENKVFVGGISNETSEASLRKAMEQHGGVQEVAIMMDNETGKTRGFGFVLFENDDDARKVVALNRKIEVDGKPINIEWAKPKDSNGYGGGGGGGGSRDFRGGGRNSFGGGHDRGGRGFSRGGDRNGDRSRGGDRGRGGSDVNKVFCGNVNDKIQLGDFESYFRTIGHVTDAMIMRDQEGRSRGFGFVTFASPDDASRAVMDAPHNINGVNVRCEHAKSRESGGGGGGGGGGGRSYGRGGGRGGRSYDRGGRSYGHGDRYSHGNGHSHNGSGGRAYDYDTPSRGYDGYERRNDGYGRSDGYGGGSDSRDRREYGRTDSYDRNPGYGDYGQMRDGLNGPPFDRYGDRYSGHSYDQHSYDGHGNYVAGGEHGYRGRAGGVSPRRRDERAYVSRRTYEDGDYDRMPPRDPYRSSPRSDQYEAQSYPSSYAMDSRRYEYPSSPRDGRGRTQPTSSSDYGRPPMGGAGQYESSGGYDARPSNIPSNGGGGRYDSGPISSGDYGPIRTSREQRSYNPYR